MSKAQTATEYLVILAIVIVIGLIVVGVLGAIPSIGGGAMDSSSRAVLQSQTPVAVDSYAIDTLGTQVRFKNTGSSTLRLTGFYINSIYADLSVTLSSGQSYVAFTPVGRTLDSIPFSYDLDISYTDIRSSASYVMNNSELQLVGKSSSGSSNAKHSWYDDVVFHYTFDDSASIATDMSEKDNDGSYDYGATIYPEYVTGYKGVGLYNDGASTLDQRIQVGTIGSHPEFNDTSFTFTAWTKPDSISAGNIFIRIGSGSDLLYNLRTDGVIQIHDGTNFRNAINLVDMNTSKWQHVALVFNSATNIDYYVDGEHIGNYDLSYGGLNPSRLVSSSRIEFLGTTGTFSQTYNGYIDEMMYFSRPLTANEVMQVYQSTLQMS